MTREEREEFRERYRQQLRSRLPDPDAVECEARQEVRRELRGLQAAERRRGIAHGARRATISGLVAWLMSSATAGAIGGGLAAVALIGSWSAMKAGAASGGSGLVVAAALLRQFERGSE